ncbi:hypothetical protein QKU48_gp0783 [Fadolivirus algeromassiliense]|jgi:hypothetical protein|uniref:Uncharacterized protein n=1 Tax=Fadolivirus FV1/VV64 TaxID=3070911 RepID=A0A7D3R171_9VIRU|nr:hypothetical protein QKU48_gp0783 [Fadolivirus algeromassiliense]QKF94241.1 hypothetical protein Fadolivirus_1_783 [Fadolivirus FV1/VV64]
MADQDPNIDVQSDDDYDDGYDEDMSQSIQNNNNQYTSNDNNNVAISVNGITYDELKQMKLSWNQQHSIAQCIYCQKFYNRGINGNGSMITQEFDPTGEAVCYHCIFWLNYSMEARQLVDGAFGKTILEYILECKESHDQSSCQRNSAEGGCFLCDSLNEVPIEGILGGEVLAVPKTTKVKQSEPEEYSFKISI